LTFIGLAVLEDRFHIPVFGLGIFENREDAAGRAHLIFNLVYGVKPVFAVLNVALDDKERVARDVHAINIAPINIAARNAAEAVRRLGEFYRPSQDAELHAHRS